MKKVIYTFAIYENNPSFLSFTLPTIIAYARSVGADFKLISNKSQIDPRYPRSEIIREKIKDAPHFSKLYALEEFVYSGYDQMMLIDDDILVRNSGLDLFSLYKPGGFLASQHIGENGVPYLSLFESEEKNQKLQINYINKNSDTGEKGEYLESQLRNIINSGLYVTDKMTANHLLSSFKAPIGDYSKFGWYDQGYIMDRLAELKVPIQEIPPVTHANPCRIPCDKEKKSIKDRNTDFYHFNGLNTDQKNTLIKEFYLQNFDIFSIPVVVVGKIEN